jgi:leucyl aminopeptidase
MQSRPEIKVFAFEENIKGACYALLTDPEALSTHFTNLTDNEGSSHGTLNSEDFQKTRLTFWHQSGVLELFPCLQEKSSDLSENGIRRSLGIILQEAGQKKLKSLNLQLMETKKNRLERILQLVAETVGLYYYSYKDWSQISQKPSKSTQSIQNFCVRLPKTVPLADTQRHVEKGLFWADVCNFARYLSETPGNELVPEGLAQAGSLRLKDYEIKSNILDAATLDAQGFGGIVAVGKGSIHKPCLGILDYHPPAATKTVVLVGKGVTFDTGGYSIKGKAYHNEMKFDMCGAANVIGILEILAQEKFPHRVVGLLPCAENAIGPNALRPGDVYKAWNGKSIEVLNTDAEGRLLLADTLSFSKTYDPDLIIDIATLTSGTNAIAGSYAGVAFTNQATLFESYKPFAHSYAEPFVSLEILPDVIENMKSQVADYCNMHHKWSASAGSMHAAAFLQEFVPDNTPWIHLDIASVAYHGKENGYMSTKGSSAYGVRSVAHWLMSGVWLKSI